ncbi:hypothetical protein A2818_01610 [Candidatus Nomurabacteria bacterium RIFCSPHIGHO2_01_FULL_40_12]|uniref:Uncharacterized protein n=1 Tax=Candidatus Nomurabacteria bacterium RIFCSPHIGHO2_01_FULL_40_12 TaxID=1801737 RepID=A0A1F6V1J4_9BACT|nr:MAG: hypothetical protein A2818_01610 [Candidatus Nomurabacteria bacterium RIFCSPHIGHO2_01_FULL_40_12]
MKTESENKICQNCKKDFIIEPDDFGFYEQMKVPPPLWCSHCRLLRRMAWYGYRILYKRKCNFTGENIITFYHPDLPFKVYKQDIWWSDKWDPKSYGRDYDFSRPFFKQFKELLNEVPKAALHTEYTTMINSEYCNSASYQKNGYLCFRHITGEDSAYTNGVLNSKDSLDVAYSADPELCYEIIDVRKCFQTFFSQDCENCQNVYFSRDLVNCSDCFGCTSLRNKNYCIFNEQLTRDEYQRRFKELDLGNVKNIQKFKKQAYALSLNYPRRATMGRNNTNVSGDYVYNSKNAHNVYCVSDSENIRYCQLFMKGGVHNCYDFTAFGSSSEWVYEATWTGLNTSNVKFSVWNYRNHDTEYTFGCHGCGYLFGCVGLRKAEYCIFNKQYTKEEYFPLVEKIKKQMNDMPFIDKRGLEHRYGGQIPIDLCPWAYNESTAYEFFPMNKEEAIAKGFTWRDPDQREYLPATTVVPDHIKDVTDDILQAILKCEACGKNYQIIPKELVFLRRFNLPIPNHCPLCRDRARIKQLNPMQTYNRKCDKCDMAIETSYASDRPEMVYCESCYKQEVY